MDAPPQKFIDWWLSKSCEERQRFLADPSTSATVKDNIAALEAYCLSNNYHVHAQSALQPRPFPRSVLGSSAVATRWPDIFYAHPIRAAGRYVDAAEREQRELQGLHHVGQVTRRVEEFLQAHLTTSLDNRGEGEAVKKIATLMVKVLLTAAMAAVQREHISSQIDAEEAASTRQLSNRILRLRSKKGAGDTEDCNNDEDDVLTSPTIVSSKPISALQREARGLLGMYGLLHGWQPLPKRQRELEEDGGSRWRQLRSDTSQEERKDHAHDHAHLPQAKKDVRRGVDRLEIKGRDIRLAIADIMEADDWLTPST